MSEEKSVGSINESESTKESKKKNFFWWCKNRKELRDRLSKPKIKEIRKDLYRIENKKIKENEKTFLN